MVDLELSEKFVDLTWNDPDAKRFKNEALLHFHAFNKRVLILTPFQFKQILQKLTKNPNREQWQTHLLRGTSSRSAVGRIW